MKGPKRRPHFAVFSGPTSTVQSSPPLVTSNAARAKYGLPLRTDPFGDPLRFDVLRPQRLAAPVTVYVEQFSAHPLERDAAALYGPPDGYLDRDGTFSKDPRGADDRPVYEITLRPEHGLYPLPYMARQADGRPWDDDGAQALDVPERSRQPFYPDASRMFEEIDRLGIGPDGTGGSLSSHAEFDFYRAAPSGGYKSGLSESDRTDIGSGDIAPELMGRDFFPYRPYHLRQDPTRAALARLTTLVQQVMSSGTYDGGIWLEGSPTIEETMYWLNLVIDTPVPIVGNAAQRPHGMLGADGDRNICDSVRYLASRIWAGPDGRDRVGCVVLQDQVVFAARDVQKGDARPGGYTATGGHGGVVASLTDVRPPALTYIPARRHTHTSEVNFARMRPSVGGVRRLGQNLETVEVRVKEASGALSAGAIPLVSIVKTGQYPGIREPSDPKIDIGVQAQIEQNLREEPLAGFVSEGLSPFGTMSRQLEGSLRIAVFSGMPVVAVGRGNAEGFTPRSRSGHFIGGNNLTATKARILLIACLLRLGSLPVAADPLQPTSAEVGAMLTSVARYQEIFDQH